MNEIHLNENHRREFLKAMGGAVAAMQIGQAIAQGQDNHKTRIKVGQIGVGHAHASKLGVFRSSPDYEIVGIVEPDAELKGRAESADPYRDLTWMTQEQLLNVPDLKLVLVETKVKDLLSAAEACVTAGKHVHLDKPAGESLPHFRRILDRAKQQKLLVQMGYMYRYNPGIQLLRQFLHDRWLGDVFEVHAVMSKVVGADDRKRFAQFRGGMMFELGCHLIDLVIGILGEPASVIAVGQHSAPIEDALTDNMLAVLQYGRAMATVKSSAMEVEGFERRHLVVCGTEGSIHIQPLDNPQAKVALSKARGEYRKGYQEVPLPRYARYVDDAADIARILRGEKASDFSYEHDLIVQETLLRAAGMEVTR